ncbi:MAG: F0F1 ATP synthase subunit B [Butyricicoccus pullicaecorum]|nr:F0F1 ATP synthase subunit B [Butyricicoccus pullicaecorum]
MEELTRAFVDLNLWSLFVTICNTLITFLIIKRFLYKPLRKMLAAREQEVRDLYTHAETDRREAEAMKRDYTASIANAKQEAAEIVSNAQKRAEKRAEDIVEQANHEAAAAKQRAEESIEQERKKAMNQMKDEIAGLSMLIASKVVEREVNPEDHKRLIDDFIDKVG